MIGVRDITYFSLLCLFLFFRFVYCQKPHFDQAEIELSVVVAPGTTECFFQKSKRDDTLEIEYQVTDANFGEIEIHHDLDINFNLYSPSGKELISDFKQSDAAHRYDVKEDGDYKICFSNQYSHFSKKTVYFEVFVDSNTDDDYGQWKEFEFSPELHYNDTMDQIKVYITKVHEDLTKIKHHQDQLKAIETRDRNLQEHNFTRVNQFSMLIIFVMVVVGTIQVIMIKSLFDEKNKLHKIFKFMS